MIQSVQHVLIHVEALQVAPDPSRHAAPATSLARSNALHAAQKPTGPLTREIFGLES